MSFPYQQQQFDILRQIRLKMDIPPVAQHAEGSTPLSVHLPELDLSAPSSPKCYNVLPSAEGSQSRMPLNPGISQPIHRPSSISPNPINFPPAAAENALSMPSIDIPVARPGSPGMNNANQFTLQPSMSGEAGTAVGTTPEDLLFNPWDFYGAPDHATYQFTNSATPFTNRLGHLYTPSPTLPLAYYSPFSRHPPQPPLTLPSMQNAASSAPLRGFDNTGTSYTTPSLEGNAVHHCIDPVLRQAPETFTVSGAEDMSAHISTQSGHSPDPSTNAIASSPTPAPLILCRYGNCSQSFEDLASFKRHLQSEEHNGHQLPRGKGRNGAHYSCQWRGCDHGRPLTSSSIVRHILTHTRVRSRCPFCEKNFPREDTLSKHVKDSHPGKQLRPGRRRRQSARYGPY